MSQICSHCGAPVVETANICPYCRIQYNRPNRIDATSPYFEVKLKNETLKMYIAEMRDCSIVDTDRDIKGRVCANVVREHCRRIVLVEV